MEEEKAFGENSVYVQIAGNHTLPDDSFSLKYIFHKAQRVRKGT